MAVDLKNIVRVMHERNAALEETPLSSYVKSDNKVNEDIVDVIKEHVPKDIIKSMDNLASREMSRKVV